MLEVGHHYERVLDSCQQTREPFIFIVITLYTPVCVYLFTVVSKQPYPIADFSQYPKEGFRLVKSLQLNITLSSISTTLQMTGLIHECQPTCVCVPFLSL